MSERKIVINGVEYENVAYESGYVTLVNSKDASDRRQMTETELADYLRKNQPRESMKEEFSIEMQARNPVYLINNKEY